MSPMLNLPEQEEKKFIDTQKLMEGVKERYQALEDQQDVITLQKGQAGLDYAVCK